MNEMIFSWAEDASGKMVHVDDVRQGLKCGCTCPCCHEQLQARHGEIRAHGFAHHSEIRRANLRICYMVIMYKLAEQIIQQEKRIRVPSYYGIFKERELKFTDVVVDSRYDREDKQPDVIATTADGERFLIEFTFAYKIQHKEKIDYRQLNCIEIDLSAQTLESLQDFLLYSSEHRKWLNNQAYFERIESTYSQYGKLVKVTEETDCAGCPINDRCCGIRLKGQSNPIRIENSGHSYRVCKTEEYENQIKEAEEKRKQEEAQKRLQEKELRERRERELLQKAELERQDAIRAEKAAIMRREQEQKEAIETSRISPELRTCFMCRSNLDWMCRNDGYAHCGPYLSLGVPKNTPPDTAKTCSGFRIKLRNK